MNNINTTIRLKSSDMTPKQKEEKSNSNKNQQLINKVAESTKKDIPKEKNSNKKSNEISPKKTINAFTLFFENIKPVLKNEGLKGKEIVKEVGIRWQNATEQEKKKYEDLLSAKDANKPISENSPSLNQENKSKFAKNKRSYRDVNTTYDDEDRDKRGKLLIDKKSGGENTNTFVEKTSNDLAKLKRERTLFENNPEEELMKFFILSGEEIKFKEIITDEIKKTWMYETRPRIFDFIMYGIGLMRGTFLETNAEQAVDDVKYSVDTFRMPKVNEHRLTYFIINYHFNNNVTNAKLFFEVSSYYQKLAKDFKYIREVIFHENETMFILCTLEQQFMIKIPRILQISGPENSIIEFEIDNINYTTSFEKKICILNVSLEEIKKIIPENTFSFSMIPNLQGEETFCPCALGSVEISEGVELYVDKKWQKIVALKDTKIIKFQGEVYFNYMTTEALFKIAEIMDEDPKIVISFSPALPQEVPYEISNLFHKYSMLNKSDITERNNIAFDTQYELLINVLPVRHGRLFVERFYQQLFCFCAVDSRVKLNVPAVARLPETSQLAQGTIIGDTIISDGRTRIRGVLYR